MSLRPVMRSEWTATARRPLLYVCAAVFFLLAFQTVAITSPTASGLIRIGSQWHNSPYVVAKLTTVLSVLALFAAALLIAPAVQRDFQHRSHPFFLSLPVTRAEYLIGRFSGAFGATFLIFLAAMAGVLAAALSIPSAFIGPHRLIAFVEPLLLFALPNLLLTGAICFAAATLGRSMLGVYVAAVVTMVVLGAGQSIAGEALQKGMLHGTWATIGALAEPFGAVALQIVTATWSPAEKNLRAIPLDRLLLVHRLLWSGVAVGVLALTCRRFRRVEVPDARRRRSRAAATEKAPVAALAELRRLTLVHTTRQALRQYAALTMRELRLTVRHLAFIVLALATLANLSSNFLGNVRGQHVFPRTGFFLQHALREDMFVILLTVFFAGVLVWREREHRSHELFDSQPLSDAILYGSKLSALLLLQAAYAALVMGYGVFVQLVLFRYTHLEPGVYFAAVFGVKLLGWWAIGVVAFLLQAVSRNVSMGYAASAVVLGAASLLPPLGSADGLLRPGFTPSFVYSDMNGWGQFAAPLVWVRVYWVLVAIGLAMLAASRWPRGASRGSLARVTPRARLVLGAVVLAAAGCAAVIVANTTSLSPKRMEALRVEYERAYRRFAALPQPSVEAVDVDAGFFPRRRRLHLRGSLTLRNTTGAPIEAVHVTLLPVRLAAQARLELDRAVSQTRRDAGYAVFTLAAPLAVGQVAALRYDYELAARGFDEDGHLVRNGSVITGNDPEFFPQIGYQSKLELDDPAARQRNGLSGAPSEAGRALPHWTTFHASVSTDAGQQPVASGERLREWTNGSRRTAEFTARGVAGQLFLLASGTYSRASRRIGGVDVEVLHHAGHPDNVARMFAGVQCGLQFGSEHLAPYPHPTLRIVELPAYTIQGNAQALPTTIVWGEEGGFITDVARDPGIDRVFSTAAHEAGHQWWGSGVLTMNEVLADDVRVGCLDRTFGRERTVEFLRDMRWQYFRRRGVARDTGRSEAERPLREGGQYDSGFILMWRLRRVLGDDVVNAALRDVVAELAYRPDRAPSPVVVARALERRAPAELRPLIADTFDRITLHPIRITEARAMKLDDGRYRVIVSADLRKTYGEVRAPLANYADWIDVGVYGEDGQLLSLTTQRITDPRRALSVIVSAAPSRVVLDPLSTLLDADASDNELAIAR